METSTVFFQSKLLKEEVGGFIILVFAVGTAMLVPKSITKIAACLFCLLLLCCEGRYY